mgnify:CR=1 FL=1
MIHPDLTIIIHVYNRQNALDEHIANWELLPPQYRNKIEIICIDDHSDTPLFARSKNLNLRLFRVLDDIDWNMPGCKNLGAIHAKADWILFHDVDNFPRVTDLCRIIDSIESLEKSTLYRFARSINGEMVESHINTLLLSKDGFFKAGMIDEDFAGHYGYEDVHFNMIWVKKIGSSIIFDDIIFYEKDLKTEKLDRDTSRNQILGTNKIYLQDYSNSVGKLRFNWTEVRVEQT